MPDPLVLTVNANVLIVNVAVTEQFKDGIEPLYVEPLGVPPHVEDQEVNELPVPGVAVHEYEVPAVIPDPEGVHTFVPVPVPAVAVDNVNVGIEIVYVALPTAEFA